MSKRLIINADDFGVSEDINDGIIECLTKGTVTDLSILPTGKAYKHAVNLAFLNTVKHVGVHLALTGEFDAIGSHEKAPSLVNRNGKFVKTFPALIGKDFFGRINEDEIYREFKAQIKRVKDDKFTVTHVDSHEHIHMYPPILKIVLRVMKEEGIRYVRFPLERVDILSRFKEPFNNLRHMALIFMCGLSKGLLRDNRVMYNDHFVGHFHAHRLNRTDFLSALTDMQGGLTEIGCHPGFFGREIQANRPWYRYCGQELKVLCSKEFIDAIKASGIRLVSYAQA